MADLTHSMQISAAGLKAQGERLRVISENIANAGSTALTPDQDPYRRKLVTFGNVLNRNLGTNLVEMGALASGALVKTLASRLSVQGCVLRHGLLDPKVAKCIPREEAERLRVLPMFRVHDELTVAMAEPQSLPTIDRLVSLTGCCEQAVKITGLVATDTAAQKCLATAPYARFLHAAGQAHTACYCVAKARQRPQFTGQRPDDDDRLYTFAAQPL